jgi:hypothetical protein
VTNTDSEFGPRGSRDTEIDTNSDWIDRIGRAQEVAGLDQSPSY